MSFKISIEEDKEMSSDHIIIKCRSSNKHIQNIKTYIEDLDIQINGTSEGEFVRINPKDILYMESVDKRTYAYIIKEVLEIDYRLYEIENILSPKIFFRCSKSTIVNVNHVERISPMLNRNLLLTMVNGERVTLSRRRRKDFDRLIGMER